MPTLSQSLQKIEVRGRSKEEAERVKTAQKKKWKREEGMEWR